MCIVGLARVGEQGAWIALSWDEAQTIQEVQITFDTGFKRELTLTSADQHDKHMIRAPQPETVRDYQLQAQAADGSWTTLESVSENHLRLRRHHH